MGTFWNNWAIAYRNGQAIFMALGVGAILVWALASPGGEFVRQDRVIATVLEVKQTKKGNLVKFELPGGKHTFLFIGQGTPKVGEKRPIYINVYDNGKNYASYDSIEWILNY